MKVTQISEEAIKLYQEGLAIETVAEELGVSYRTARKAINLNGLITRDPSTRVKGRTDPRGGKKVVKKR
jgi:orotate phosphoribosyltransferase-like protein